MNGPYGPRSAPCAFRALLAAAALAAMTALLPAGTAHARGDSGDSEEYVTPFEAPWVTVIGARRWDVYRDDYERHYHVGKGTPFKMAVRFSKEVKLERRHIRVEGGRILKVANWENSEYGDEWKVRIRPTTEGRVTVTFPAGTSWNVDGEATETLKLKGTFSQHFWGPKPSMRVRSARAKEKEGSLRFTISLDRRATEVTTVDYATSDGSAKAGEDYTAVSGTLTFAKGEHIKYITVDFLDDAKDEGREYFKFKLSNARGAFIDRGNARGIILNSDPLPKASMARFGRSVASQIVDTVTGRFDEDGDRSHVTVANRRIEAARMDLTREPVSGSRAMSAHELLAGSSFHFTTGELGSGLSMSAWGRAATSGFSAAGIEDMAMAGSVTTGVVGTDIRAGRLLSGMAMSHSRGEDRFGLASGLASNRGGGTGESTLTSFHPYMQLRLGGHSSLWALAGHGTGTFTLTERGGDPIETGIAMTMAAVGSRAALLAPDEAGGLALALKADAFWVQMASDAVRSGRTGNLASSEARASRMRLSLEGSRAFALGGGVLTPTVEAGLRQDDGDAETGSGFELGTGVLYTATGVTVEGAVRGIVSHGQEGYEEWTASATMRVNPGAGRALGLGMAEPYAGLGLAGQGGGRDVHVGSRWQLGPALSMSVEGAQDEAGERSLMLRSALRW